MDINSIQALSGQTNQTKSATAKSTDNSFATYYNDAKAKTTSLDAIFQKAAAKYGVDVNLLKAIGKAESGFDPNSTSHSGAMGIMQLMPGTAKYLGVKDAYDPEQNIMGGAKLISQLISDYNGNLKLALAAYNAGSGNVKKYGGIPPFKETQNYVKKVLAYYDEGVNIPSDKSVVSSQNSVSSASSGSADTASVTTSENVAIVNVNEEIKAALNPTQSEKLLNSLQELMEKLREEDTSYSYSEYARFMQVYLDGIAVSTLSATGESREDLEEDLKEKLNQFHKDFGMPSETTEQDDALLASQSINYSPAVLDLLAKKNSN